MHTLNTYSNTNVLKTFVGLVQIFYGFLQFFFLRISNFFGLSITEET
jgi:hypothetical protein